MSGIVGIINTDGAPVDRGLLRRLTDLMAFRGPEAQEVWAGGHVAFGHALLRTAREAEAERQPFSIDGQVWITADARIDGRAALARKLAGERGRDLTAAPAPELILRAYAAWGDGCLEHLIGDFAFAIWDAPRRRLFCARDRFGAKPFYFARAADTLIVSNTLKCVLRHPAVTDRLNDQAIADFLIFGSNQEPGTTAFADVRRLPQAHSLVWEDGRLALSRYWTPTGERPLRYRRAGEYVEHFREVLDSAVADRLGAGGVSVLMSGGLDSSAVAAAAKKASVREPGARPVRAYTTVYDSLIPDRERYYSGLVARHLDIPIRYLVADDYTLLERWGRPPLSSPEPSDDMLFAAFRHEQFGRIAAYGRVALTGLGGDPALLASPAYVSSLLRGGRLLEFASGSLRYLVSRRSVPPVGIRTFLGRRLKRERPRRRPPYPDWLDSGVEARLELRARWEELTREPPLPGRALRPEALRQIVSPLWANMLEGNDPGVTTFQVEVCHPLLDTRLIDFVLSVPPLPWCLDKELLRAAMRDSLPEEVRMRPKAPLAGDPIYENLRRTSAHLYDTFKPSPEFARYVSPKRLPGFTGRTAADQAWLFTRPYGLNIWLQQLRG